MTKQKQTCPMCEYMTIQEGLNCEFCDLTMENLHFDIKDAVSEAIGRLGVGKATLYAEQLLAVSAEALNEAIKESTCNNKK